MPPKEVFRLSDSRQQRIHRRLELIGQGPADFFHDACRFMATEPHFRSTTHFVSHALREIESSLRDVLETYKERAERLEEEKKKKNIPAEENHRKEILAILRGLGIPEDDRVAQAWLRLPGKENEFALHARAHRDNLDRARPLNAEFRQFWDDMQAVLDLILQKFESRYLESFGVLDELLTKPAPSKADLKILRLNVPNNRVAFRYFFDRLNSPDWIQPLRDGGFFKHTLEPDLNPETGALMHSYWAQSRYLARMATAPSASAETQRAVLDIALETETENVLTYMDFVDAASAMPPVLAGELAPKAIEWLKSSSHTLMPVKLAALAARLAGGGEVAAALRLARAVFAVLPDPRDAEPVDDTEGNVFWSPTPRAHFRRGQYRQELRKNFPAVVEAAGLSALSLLCALLEDAIRLSQRRRERAEGEDRSHIWQPEVENERDFQPRNWLVAAVLNASEQIIEKDPNRLTEVVALLEARPRPIFKRVALHLLHKSNDDDAEVRDLITARLADRELFAAWEFKHEYFSLAGAHFALLSPADQERILSWIDEGPDVEAYGRTREWLQGTPPTEEDVADYVRHWKLERLTPLRETLSDRRKEEYDELRAALGEMNIAAPKPDVQAVDRELESPKSKDEFRSMGVDEIVPFLRSWQASGHHGEASRAGLRYELASVIAEEPDRFAAAAAEFGSLGPAHLGTLISGLRQALTNRIPFSWHPVLEACRSVISLSAENDNEDGRDDESRKSDVYSLKQSITELLKAGLSRGLGAAEIPFDLRDIVWNTLRPLTDEFDAPPRQHTVYYSSDESDGKPEVVNSIRVEAVNCVLQYAEWVERHLEADIDPEERRARGFDDMPEVRGILDKHLDLEERFDVIVSTGVVHHLEDPPRGLANLCRHLTGDGVICLWHYHPFGEFDRLIGRELLLTLWDGRRSDLAAGQRIMELLRLRLPAEQYGTAATQKAGDRSQLSIDADAFMHPIVNAYRFDEAMAMFEGCDVDWVAVNGINTLKTMKLIDLMQVEELGRELCLWDTGLFEEESLVGLYRSLTKLDKLKVIELLSKPTGFTILAGRQDSFRKLGSRIAGNSIPRQELPKPYPRLLRV